MPWLVLLPVGAAIGASLGYAIEKVRLAPVLRSVAAGVAGMVLAAASTAGLVYLYLRWRGDSVFGVRIEDSAVLSIVAGIAAVTFTFALLHWSVAYVAGLVGRPVQYTGIVFGGIGGLAGAVPAAWAMAGLSWFLV